MDAIVYTSNAGHTELYARMLAKHTGLHAYELKAAENVLPAGTTVVYFGWIMGGTVMGYKEAAKRFDCRAVAGVGMGVTGEEELRTKNLVPENIPVFSLKGGFEIGKLHGFYKLMMRVMRAASKRQKNADPATEALLTDANLVKSENLSAVFEWYGENEEKICG